MTENYSDGWHPVVRSEELRRGDNIVAGFAGGFELALWRAANGEAQVWENRCPHRSVRLTLGQVVGDRISCAYHGWQYAAGSGQCSGIPAHPDIAPPRNVCAKTYRVVEAAGMVWTRLNDDEAHAPPADTVPASWSFCRSLAIRAPAATVSRALGQSDWKARGPARYGRLGGVEACGLLLDAQPELALLHLWTEAQPGTPQMAEAHAGARRLRASIEAASQQAR